MFPNHLSPPSSSEVDSCPPLASWSSLGQDYRSRGHGKNLLLTITSHSDTNRCLLIDLSSEVPGNQHIVRPLLVSVSVSRRRRRCGCRCSSAFSHPPAAAVSALTSLSLTHSLTRSPLIHSHESLTIAVFVCISSRQTAVPPPTTTTLRVARRTAFDP